MSLNMPTKNCGNCLFGMQAPGEGMLKCVCQTSRYSGQKRSAKMTCDKFVCEAEVRARMQKLKGEYLKFGLKFGFEGWLYRVVYGESGFLLVIPLERLGENLEEVKMHAVE